MRFPLWGERERILIARGGFSEQGKRTTIKNNSRRLKVALSMSEKETFFIFITSEFLAEKKEQNNVWGSSTWLMSSDGGE